MTDHEGTAMPNDTGTPLTAEQQDALQWIRTSAAGVDEWVTARDNCMESARELGVDELLIQQAAGIL